MQSSFLRLTRGLAAASALFCLTLGLAARPAHAQAGYYTYTLSGVGFSNGIQNSSGTASGYFDYDPTTDQVGTVDIVTSNGTNVNSQKVLGSTYTSASFVSSGEINFDSAAGGDLMFGLPDPLTGVGTFAVDPSEFAVDPPGKTYGTYRYGSSGQLIGTPEASAVPELSPLAAVGLLSVLGCGALGLAGAKRRRTASAAE